MRSIPTSATMLRNGWTSEVGGLIVQQLTRIYFFQKGYNNKQRRGKTQSLFVKYSWRQVLACLPT